MNLKKPDFWDSKKPNLYSYLLLPFSILLIFFNLLIKKSKTKFSNIKTICVGNIYVGGTGKTPTAINLRSVLNKLDYKTAFVKKYYTNQADEQKILSNNGELFCKKTRSEGLNCAINKNYNLAIIDDGLQDRYLSYDISIVCFNIENWIGNGFLLPAGPLRENLKSLKKYDAVILNGNEENTDYIKTKIKEYNPNIETFEGVYSITNLSELNKNYDYLVFAGIGSPKTFIKTLINNKFKVHKTLFYPDHYHYSKDDILNIKNEAKKLNLKILTTEKDFIRLSSFDAIDINSVKANLIIKDENRLIKFLKSKL